ncbi:hypothetical protein ACFLTE_07825 [Bacteroidota bacterium]
MQRKLYMHYKECLNNNNLPKLSDTGFSVFSQFEEDGLLLYIFAIIGEINKTFIEIGSNNGINSNCANLFFHFGWHGLFIDGDRKCINRGIQFYSKYPHPWNYQPKFICDMVKRENINEIIKEAGFEGEIDLMSIDINGNDYWIWDAIEIIKPNVVIIETHIEFGLNNIVVPYDPNYFYPGKHKHYHGASPVAMKKLADKKGYRLVGANQLGFNTIYIKRGVGDELIPEVDVESILQHRSVKECYKSFEEIKDWEYINP